jgi:hypothetical protein
VFVEHRSVITRVLLASFGPLIFIPGKETAFTYKNLSKANTVVYAQHEILQGVPLIEFTGYKLITVNMTCNFVAGWTLDPSLAVLAFETAQANPVAMPLILGTTPIGRGLISSFVIQEVQSKFTRFGTDGSPIEATVDVKFLEAGSILPSLGQLASSILGGAGISVGASLGPVSVGASIGV